jgi:hypothetical protein
LRYVADVLRRSDAVSALIPIAADTEAGGACPTALRTRTYCEVDRNHAAMLFTNPAVT